MPTIRTKDGTALYLKDWGEGRPVVLIHGWPLDADMWEYQALALAEHGYRVVAYDRRGFGRSDQPWTGYDYDTLSDDLKDVLEALDLSDVALVGFSMGGGEIARYMSRHGGARVTRAVLVSSVVPFLLKTSDHPEGVDGSVFEGMVAGLRADRAHFLADFSKTFFGVTLLKSPASAELIQWTGTLAMMASPRATVACVKAFGETDFRRDLPHFKVPTLVIHGDGDQTVPIDVSGRAATAGIAGATFITYEGAPHAVPLTHPQRLNDDLIAFLSR